MIHAYIPSTSPRRITIVLRAHHHEREMTTDDAQHFDTLSSLRRAVKSYRHAHPLGQCRVLLRFADGRLFRAMVMSSLVGWLEKKFGSVEVVEDWGYIEALPAPPRAVSEAPWRQDGHTRPSSHRNHS